MRYLIKYLRLTGTERLLLAEAVMLLGMARLAILCMPFRRLVSYLGVVKATAPPALQPVKYELVSQVSWAVQTAARRVPWQAVCLPQAIAAKLMLRRRGVASALYLGLLKQTGLQAHAWLTVGDVMVTGGSRRQHFTAITVFV